ncbi:AAA family ATPase [Brevibacterium litoralis]|uniref:AAA family ATPase n=1 Tax=Brevibacterium litoralis TaxID=3138935 RepID=UPI0032ECF3CC
MSIHSTTRPRAVRTDGTHRTDRTDTTLVLLGGVPGAGKTQTLRSLRAAHSGIRTNDPERWRSRIERFLPHVPYPVIRPIVHVLGHLDALRLVLGSVDVPVVLHDPGTRRWTRRAIVTLAHARGRRPSAVYLDVPRDQALTGQRDRGRIVRSRAFDRHWTHWQTIRTRIRAGRPPGDGERWASVHLVDREHALGTVAALLRCHGDALDDRGAPTPPQALTTR